MQFYGYKDEIVVVRVTDITGRLVEEKELQVTTHEQTLALDERAQPGGIYFISVTSGLGKTVLRVVKY